MSNAVSSTTRKWPLSSYQPSDNGGNVSPTEAVRGLESRFTNRKVLIIPSLAGGFAKHGLPTLSATRPAFANYLKLLTRHHEEVYLPQEWPGALGTAALQAPIYSVGSWNEEYEGHAVLPAQFNLALTDSEQQGFDFFDGP